MKKYWAMKWIKDLETRGRRQAKRELANGKGAFCCLGRLCVIAGAERKGNLFDGEASILPVSVMNKTGIGADCVDLPEEIEYRGEQCSALTELNDAGMPFREIAKVIRKNWRKL